MKAVLLCNIEQKEEILQKPINEDVELVFCIDDLNVFKTTAGDAFFDLINEDPTTFPNQKDALLFINAVNKTLKELPEKSIRINAWSGFLKRDTIELVATEAQKHKVDGVMNQLGWKFQFVADEPGMVAPRIIAMIINEAYFGLEDAISTKEEIDIAMKLGTNYPYGPFEWAEKIGKKQILLLLETLTKLDKRYTPSKLLVQEANLDIP